MSSKQGGVVTLDLRKLAMLSKSEKGGSSKTHTMLSSTDGLKEKRDYFVSINQYEPNQ
jgi:hypothetical protein